MNTLEKLLERIVKTESGCWEWIKGVNSKGYGVTCYNGKQCKSHRLIYTLIKGEIPDGLYCCHTCDNRLCCNPEHIFLGTSKDNMLDASNKGRLKGLVKKEKTKRNFPNCKYGHLYEETGYFINKAGTKQCKECIRIQSKRRYDIKKDLNTKVRVYKTKLTLEQMLMIKQLYNDGNTYAEIAILYNVSVPTISRIILNQVKILKT